MFFPPFIFSRSTSWLDGSWEREKKKRRLAGCGRIRSGCNFFFLFPFPRFRETMRTNPPHPAESRWCNNASWRRTQRYYYISGRAGVGYLKLHWNREQQWLSPASRKEEVEARVTTTVRRLLALVTLLFHERKKKRKEKERGKNQLFISRRLNERGEHSERIKANHRERSPLP